MRVRTRRPMEPVARAPLQPVAKPGGVTLPHWSRYPRGKKCSTHRGCGRCATLPADCRGWCPRVLAVCYVHPQGASTTNAMEEALQGRQTLPTRSRLGRFRASCPVDAAPARVDPCRRVSRSVWLETGLLRPAPWCALYGDGIGTLDDPPFGGAGCRPWGQRSPSEEHSDAATALR